jgi:hypothetical protein
MSRAEDILSQTITQPTAQAWRTRTHQLAEALFQSIKMKLSVPLYRAIAQGRGASLDTLDYPLNNRAWLAARFAAIPNFSYQVQRADDAAFSVNVTLSAPITIPASGLYDYTDPSPPISSAYYRLISN